MPEKQRLNIIYSNIGRGHPYYLDGLVEVFQSKYGDQIDLNTTDVFSLSSGLSGLMWKLVKKLYLIGSQGGLIGKFYERFRRSRRADKRGRLESILASGLRRFLADNQAPTLVAHPLLVSMINNLVPVYYQHGEIAAPDESLVIGADKIYVPMNETYNRFIEAGISEDRLLLSGLCIEPELAEKAEQYYHSRIKRISDNYQLCGGLFSSGAEPKQHLEKIILAVNSIKNGGGKGLIFCRAGGRLEKLIRQRLNIKILKTGFDTAELNSSLEKNLIVAVKYFNRHDENENLLRLFKYLDYFVAPSHERSNWAVGLGLPMFILHPIIGTFSPLNRQFLLESNVAADMENNSKAEHLYEYIRQLQTDGTLSNMARHGLGPDLYGFERIAENLISEIKQ